MKDGRFEWRFRRKIIFPLVIATLGAVLLAGFGVYWAAARSDAISVDRQMRTTQRAITLSIDSLAKEQETVAEWDDHFLELLKPVPDGDWLDENVGVWLYDLFGHDQVYLLSEDDEPLYAMRDGERTTPAAFFDVADDVMPMIDAVRGRAGAVPGIHDRLPGAALNPLATVLTTDQVIHDSGVTRIAGRPATVSVMRIGPYAARLEVEPEEEQLIISVRFLDGAILQHLSEQNLIASPRFAIIADPQPGEQAIEIRGDSGELIGYFLWQPELPGTLLLRDLAPAAGLLAALMAFGTAMLANWLLRSTGELQTTLVELRASEAQAQHLAFHDTLTGLPNRALFHDRLDQALARARRGEKIAVLALDLDRFKRVNDTMGHHAGDALIRQLAERLNGLARESDTVARLGGDEFAMVLGCTDARATEAICERILDAVRVPFDLMGNTAFVGISIGVIHAPENGFDRGELLRKADIALYQAKAEGRDCWRVFTSEMDETVRLRGAIEDDLRAALASGKEICLHYQPQVSSDGQKIIGLEALLRWQHPVAGPIPAHQFIHVAEEAGLIAELSELILKEACSVARRYPGLFMAVNLSPIQFRSGDLAERIIETVAASGADPLRIELEVTESVLLEDDEVVRTTLEKLRKAGFRIALDDFGTGYSSLGYLRRFEFDKIKIDRSFVQNLGRAENSAAIVHAVVRLGHAMGLAVTAEGVETRDQRSFLVAAGCNQLQGYLFSRAVPQEKLADLLSISAPRPRVA